jgi:hypothetical protein
MDDAELMYYITTALKYRSVDAVKNAFKEYMQKYYDKMMGFMPVYGLYFNMLANIDKELADGDIIKAKEIIHKIQAECKKYHN